LPKPGAPTRAVVPSEEMATELPKKSSPPESVRVAVGDEELDHDPSAVLWNT
jgi:hypothetical protein